MKGEFLLSSLTLLEFLSEKDIQNSMLISSRPGVNFLQQHLSETPNPLRAFLWKRRISLCQRKKGIGLGEYVCPEDKLLSQV